MTRLIAADLRRNLGVWAWTSVVALVCAAAVAGELAAMRGAIASATTAGDRERVEAAGAVAGFVLAVVALSTVAVLLSTTGLAIAQRERDLGLWRALGMRPGTVSAVLLGETALVGLGAGAAGSALAVPVARLLLPMLVSERVVLAGTAPQWQAGDAGACALAVAVLCMAGAGGGVRRVVRVPEVELLRRSPDSRGRRRWAGRTARVLVAVGAATGLVASWVAPVADGESAANATMGGGFALFALVIAVNPWMAPLLEGILGVLAPRRSVVCHVAAHTCRAESARSQATVLPFTIAIGLVGLFFGWRAAGASGVTVAGFASLFGPALAVAWAGGVAVIAMGADRRRRDASLLSAAGASDAQLLAVDLVESLIHTGAAIVLGLVVSVGSLLCAAHAFGTAAGTMLGEGPWIQVGATGAATLIVVGGSVVVSRWVSARRRGGALAADLRAAE
jgi:putative ABC transport system permease protein